MATGDPATGQRWQVPGPPGYPSLAPAPIWAGTQLASALTGGGRRTVTGGGATPRRSRPGQGAGSPCQPEHLGGQADDGPAPVPGPRQRASRHPAPTRGTPQWDAPPPPPP